MSWLLLVPLGMGTGFIAGLLGIGGGVLLVPLFLEFFRMQGFAGPYVQTALGTSKAVVLVSIIAAVRAHARAQRVDWPTVFRLGPWLVLGAFSGASLAAYLPGPLLRRLFAVVLAVLSVVMISPHGESHEPKRSRPHPRLLPVVSGFGTGAFASLFGIGGGVLAVPLLHRVFRKPLHLAMASSSGLMLFTAATGTCTYVAMGMVRGNPIGGTLGFVHLGALATGGLGAQVGSRLGVAVARSVRPQRLRLAFVVLLLAVALEVFLKT